MTTDPIQPVSLAAVLWNFPLVGRTRMLTHAWRDTGLDARFIEPCHSYRSRLAALIGRAEASPPFVLRPGPTRFPVRWWPRMSAARFRNMLRDAGDALRRRLDRHIDWTTAAAIVISPAWADWLDALPFRTIVYDCIDDLSVHAPRPNMLALFRAWESRLLEKCHAVVTTAESLRDDIARRRPNLPGAIIRNAVYAAAFRRAAAALPRPADLPADGRPIVGFVGALYEWIDWPLLDAAAQALPDARFVFVGPHNQPAEIERLARRPNVVLLGPRPYDAVPAYVAAFDVCWVPFAAGDITRAANPVKIYEYLALGKPVITTAVADPRSFAGLINAGADADAVIQSLRRAVFDASQGPPGDAAARMAYASANSWSARAAEYVQFLQRLRARRCRIRRAQCCDTASVVPQKRHMSHSNTQHPGPPPASGAPGPPGPSTLRTWADMIKFSHSVFALPFALVATFFAASHQPGGLPTATQLILIVVCMVAARSFAMTFNRLADAGIDAKNPRTQKRPLVTGAITTTQAWLFLLAAAMFFLLACAGFLVFAANPWPLYLSLPTLAALAAYSYAKRATRLSHFILGAVIAFAPSAAWIAIHPAGFGAAPLLLTAAILFWIAGFDIIYACQDIDVDRRDGVFSIPAALGIRSALLISRLCHVATVALLVAFGLATGSGWIYWTGCTLTAALLAAEQSVVKPNDLSRVNLAFFTLNGCVSLLMGAAAIADRLILSPHR